jgi:hypothetical protein
MTGPTDSLAHSPSFHWWLILAWIFLYISLAFFSMSKELAAPEADGPITKLPASYLKP